MSRYELTRRDALAALAAAGAGGYAATSTVWDRSDDDGRLGAEDRETLIAVAETVYPSELDGIPEFVEGYVAGRIEDRPDRREGLLEAVRTVDERAIEWFDAEYHTLDAKRRDDVLQQLGLDVVEPDPDGVDAARVRFYLVNELLYGLYSSPTGGRLVGVENPQGHPGGTTSYQRGPPE